MPDCVVTLASRSSFVFAPTAVIFIKSSDTLGAMDKNDVLTDVFATLRLRGDLYFRAEFHGRFAIEIGAERRKVRFHLVRAGRCWLTHAEGDAVELVEGDMVIVPNGAAQVLSSTPGLSSRRLEDVIAGGALENGILSYKGTGKRNRYVSLLCGFCQFDEAIDHPLVAHLPNLIVLRANHLGDRPWVAATLRLLAMEADLGAQGMDGVLARLLEIIFIQAARRLVDGGDDLSNGYVAALADPRLSRALLAMHDAPEINWTVSGLAQEAGMSRAHFAARFMAILQVPPITYLTTWRLIKARAMLRDNALATGEIARRCGYASLPSFTRRFKAEFGIGPGTFRRTCREP